MRKAEARSAGGEGRGLTIRDIAKLCGVSVSTVSRVLNDRPDVSPEVRQAVLEVIRRTNYTPRNSARSLAQPRLNAIGVIVRGGANQLYVEVIKQIEKEIGAAGYATVVHQIGETEDEIKLAAIMEREKNLCGLILLGGRTDYTAAELGLIGVPFVFSAFTNSSGTLSPWEYSSVCVDESAAAESAVLRLLALGHRDIAALVSCPGDRSMGERRLLGYTRALEREGIAPRRELIIEAGSFQPQDAYDAVSRLIDSGERFTALFAIADTMAVAAIKALEDRGIGVPAQCSVISMDGLTMSEYSIPSLTAVIQPAERIGEESVRVLLDLVNGRAGHTHVTLETDFRPGASIAPPPGE